MEKEVNFWTRYPQDEKLFDQQVKRGITIEINLDVSPAPSFLKRHYGGCSTNKMKRFLALWRENSRKFFYEHPKVKSEHVDQFIIDYAQELKKMECDEFKIDQAIHRKESELPLPSAGYQWMHDPGSFSVNKNKRNYRLWSTTYGVLWMDTFEVPGLEEKYAQSNVWPNLEEVEEFFKVNADIYEGMLSPLDAARIARRNYLLDTSYQLMISDGKLGFYEDAVEFYGVCEEIKKRRRETCWRVSALKYPYKTLDGGNFGSKWICKKTGELI